MKRSLKLTAAALAVCAAMTGFSALSFADEEVTADSAADIGITMDAPVAGGWTVNTGSFSMSKNPGAKKAFKKATKAYTGMTFKAKGLLGTQVVAGTNYCILCTATGVYPGAQANIGLVYVYEDLQGNAVITGIKILVGDLLPGGFSANTGSFTLSKNKTAYKSYKKAVKELVGVDYTPVAYLGSQVVAGTNYLVLCRSKVTAPGASEGYSLVTVYRDLKGKSSVHSIDALALGETDDLSDLAASATGLSTGGSAPSDMIANPWSEYKTVDAAAEAAGVDFKAPDAFGKYKTAYIQAMTGLAEVNYANGEKIICVRKGKGTDDVSGDYNEYKKTKKENIGDIEVTLRMNDGLVYSAVWSDGKDSYSYFAKSGISKKTALKHIKKIIELNK